MSNLTPYPVLDYILCGLLGAVLYILSAHFLWDQDIKVYAAAVRRLIAGAILGFIVYILGLPNHFMAITAGYLGIDWFEGIINKTGPRLLRYLGAKTVKGSKRSEKLLRNDITFCHGKMMSKIATLALLLFVLLIPLGCAAPASNIAVFHVEGPTGGATRILVIEDPGNLTIGSDPATYPDIRVPYDEIYVVKWKVEAFIYSTGQLDPLYTAIFDTRAEALAYYWFLQTAEIKSVLSHLIDYWSHHYFVISKFFVYDLSVKLGSNVVVTANVTTDFFGCAEVELEVGKHYLAIFTAEGYYWRGIGVIVPSPPAWFSAKVDLEEIPSP